MPIGDPTYFFDDSARDGRTTGTDGLPATSFADGCNLTASNAHGIGINVDGGPVTGQSQQFTLLDQEGNARTPQGTTVIGGDGFVDRSGNDWSSSGGAVHTGSANYDAIRTGERDTQPGDGTITPRDNVWLESLTAGWTAGDPTP